MKNCDYWKSFVRTGSVDDYLQYIACTREESSDEQGQAADPVRSYGYSHTKYGKEREGGLIAGINYRDGNGSVSHAGW
jgi:hypothetical protein